MQLIILLILKSPCSILSPSEEDIFLFQIWSHAFKRLTLWFTFKFSLSAAPPQTNVTWVFWIHIGRFLKKCFMAFHRYYTCCIRPHIWIKSRSWLTRSLENPRSLRFTFKFLLSATPPQTNATWVLRIHIWENWNFCFKVHNS